MPSDLLVYSPADVVLGGWEVEQRFIQVLNDYLFKRGVPIVPPGDLDTALLFWRQMRHRHKCPRCPKSLNKIIIVIEGKARCGNCGGVSDYRHSESELKAMKEVAQWTLRVNADLRGQPVPDIDI